MVCQWCSRHCYRTLLIKWVTKSTSSSIRNGTQRQHRTEPSRALERHCASWPTAQIQTAVDASHVSYKYICTFVKRGQRKARGTIFNTAQVIAVLKIDTEIARRPRSETGKRSYFKNKCLFLWTYLEYLTSFALVVDINWIQIIKSCSIGRTCIIYVCMPCIMATF